MYRNNRANPNGNRHVASDTSNDVSITNINDVTVELEAENVNEFKDFSKSKIYEQLKPLLMCMRLFGLYFKRTRTRKGRAYMEPVVLYCFVVNFLLVLNVIRSFTVYRFADHFDNVLVQKLLFTIWSSECAFKGLLLMWNCFKQNGLPKFFCEWDASFGHVKLDRMCLFMMKKYIFLAFLFIIVNSVVFTLILIYVPVLEHIYLEVIWKDALTFGNQLVFKIVLGILAVLNSSSSMFPVSLFVVLSFAIGKRMKKFTNELTLSIAQEDFHGRIEDFRLRHQNLCMLVDILDHVFAPMIAAIYSANIPMFCLVLYTMVTTIDIHISLVLINLFWLCFIMLQMTIVSVTAAWVNVMVSILILYTRVK